MGHSPLGMREAMIATMIYRSKIMKALPEGYTYTMFCKWEIIQSDQLQVFSSKAA